MSIRQILRIRKSFLIFLFIGISYTIFGQTGMTASDFLLNAEKETNDSLKANWIRKAHIFYINSFKFSKSDSIFESNLNLLKKTPDEYAILLRQTGWGKYLQGQNEEGDKFIKEAFEIRKDSSFLMTTQLGNANFSYLRGDYFRSLEELKAAYSFFSKQDTSVQEVSSKLAAMQNMMGFNYNDLGYYRSAIPHFEMAVLYAKKSNRADIENVAVKFLSKIYLSLGQYHKALIKLQPYRENEEIHPHLWQTLAMIYHQTGAYAQRDSLLEKWEKSVAGNDLLEVNYNDIRAELFLQENQPVQALPFIRKYSAIAGNTELIKLESDEYFSRYHLQMNQLDSAEYFAGKILVRASGFQSERLKGTALFLLGKIEQKQENLFKSQHHFENALEIFKELDQPQNILQCQEELSQIFEKKGELNTSLLYQKLYFKGKDTLELNSASREFLVTIMENLGKDINISKEEYFDKVEKLEAAQSNNWLLGGFGLLSFIGFTFLFKKLNQTKESISEKENRIKKYRFQIEEFKKSQNILKQQKSLSEKELQIHMRRHIELNREIDKISTQMERQIFTKNVPSLRELQTIKNQLEGLVPEKSTWNDLQIQFNRLYPNFTEKLAESGIKTSTMVRHCICIIMELSVRDSSKIMAISESGVKKARNRIRKEINLDKNINLSSYLKSL